MNFKPIRGKVISSLAGIALWIFSFNIFNAAHYCKLIQFLRVCEYNKFLIVRPACFSNASCIGLAAVMLRNLINIVLPFVTIYIIWSLFQKKVKKK